MDLELANKSVVITGGASNIGRAIALLFAEEGARIFVADIDMQSAIEVAELAKCRGAAAAHALKTDVTDLPQVEELFKKVVSEYHQIDVLVNCVGWDDMMPFTETTPDLWQKVIGLNYVSMLNCCKTVLDQMIEQQSGVIVSISSDASRQGEALEAVYSGAKAAVNSFMKSLARENGRFGIRCNTLCPGLTLPDEHDISTHSMWVNRDERISAQQLEKAAAALPLMKVGQPQDIAHAAVFLASNKCAGHITGQVISVNGGYSMAG